ncbi:MAG TPA: AI-2E family transporter [Verrucomicrobiae bacterium]|jgi:predicted PurR-regulated permease PerM
MSLPARLSYAFIAVTIIAAGWLHLATPLVTVLFCFFALHVLSFGGRKWLSIALFLILLTGAGVGFYYFLKQTIQAAPRIAETTIPVVLEYAEKRHIELPFSDYTSLRELTIRTVKREAADLGKYAGVALVQFAAVLIGIVVAVSLFINSRFDLATDKPAQSNNLYTTTATEIAHRFATFYESFATVMGAQIAISAINTILTAGFLFWNHLPYAKVLVGVTFLCGLLPIIGNLISNTLIVGIAFTISPKMALFALIFLVVLHKTEYFLNSKIIGDRIQNPMWLTLIGLVLGEKLMGIPGMILAPVILHYIKVEAKRNRVSRGQGGAEKIVTTETVN